MDVVTRSEGLSPHRREGNRMMCHHAVTVPQYIEEELHVYKLWVVGKQPFVRLAFVIHAHGHVWLHHGWCVTTVASNLDHDVLIVCGFLFRKIRT